MAIKVGINGFGRIGRVALRIMVERGSSSYQICGINLRNADLDYMVYQVKYDSVFRTFRDTVEHDDRHLIINGKKIRVYSESDITQIPWDDCGAEYIIESTGAFNTVEKASAHLQNGAKKVIISAPSKDDVMPTFVMGVNHLKYTPDMNVVSNASCTTNCLAPVAKVLLEKFGIKRGYMNTIHSYTNDQKILDLPHKDLRRARAAAMSMIPTTTGAARAVSLVLPELAGKLDGFATRVPTPDGSMVDLTVELEREVTIEEINAAMKEAAEGELAGVLEYTEDPIVSIDIVGNNHSSIFDSKLTMVMGGKSNMVKVVSWYDNEWGYSNRVKDLVKILL